MIDFINRVNELQRLERLRSLSPSPFVVIVGRRRVGKTRLVREFIKNIDNSAYFFVEEKRAHLLLNDFSSIAGEGLLFRDWEGFIRHVLTRFQVVVIDEFQNFNRVDPSFFSALQRVLDEEAPRAMLVAVGSYVGMMRRIFEDRKAPLFGRATEIWTLPPLPMKDIIRTVQGSFEDQITLYALFGGYPKYYVICHQYRTFEPEKVLSELIVQKYGPLSREPHHILLQEFGSEYRTYFSLLEAIAKGKSSYVDIANYTGLSTTTLARYLQELLSFGVVEKRFPITEGPRSKKSRYFILDQFIRFWFRYLFPHTDLQESERYGELTKLILKDLPSFVAAEFEHIVRSLLKGDFSMIGSWWNRKGDEIDVLGIDRQNRRLLFGEVKWTNRKLSWEVVRQLIEKSRLVTDTKGYGFKGYETRFLVVSKSGFTTQGLKRMESEGIIHWDLDDLENLIHGRKPVELGF